VLTTTHIALGCAVTLSLPREWLSELSRLGVPYLYGDDWEWCWVALLLGVILPDIDHGRSLFRYPGRRLKGVLPSVVVSMINGVGWCISLLPRALFSHRGVTHAPFLAASSLCAAFWLGFESPVVYWCSWGYALHLLGDFLTKGGIPLLAPLTWARFSLLPLRTGGRGERWVSGVLWGYLVWCFLQHRFDHGQLNIALRRFSELF